MESIKNRDDRDITQVKRNLESQNSTLDLLVRQVNLVIDSVGKDLEMLRYELESLKKRVRKIEDLRADVDERRKV